jgi:glycosyltransferase involved in cell wall biosynthesis
MSWVGQRCDKIGIDIVELYNRAWYIPTTAKRILHIDNDHIRENHKRALQAADKVVLISDYVYKMTMEKLPEFDGKYVINKLGVNLDIYHPGTKDDFPTLVWLGLIGRNKGFHVFKNTADRLMEIIPDLQIWIIGPINMEGKDSGREFQAVKEQNRRYTFFGFLDEAQVADRLRRAWLMLAPMTFPYTWSLAVMEALASGTPAIVTPIGGLTEIVIEGETGWLCESQDDIFKKTLAVMNDMSLSESIGACARKYAEKFDWKFFAERATAIYKEVYDA